MRSLPVANPPRRFQPHDIAYDEGQAPDAELLIYEDASRSILSRNDSPDIGFDFSVNPYRGCMHACAYCYARPGHEYLGFGAGTDFDRRIVVKHRAPELLRQAFAKRSWQGKMVVFSGVTDCYQPLEGSLRLTRGCLEVCRDFANPVGIITKGVLIERDVDLLVELAARAEVRVAISLPLFDAELARALEPYAPSPARRLRTIERLARAGLSVGVSVSPLIPGVSESEIEPVLRHAHDAGAQSAFCVLLRLPGAVQAVFEERVRKVLPLRAEKILRRLREAHGGVVYRSEFGQRQRGQGPYADMLQNLFERTARQVGIALHRSDMQTGREISAFPPPSRAEHRAALTAARQPASTQLGLFEAAAMGRLPSR